MVGRGARITDKIYKDGFTVIDAGGNIDMHQKWSTERDWAAIFRGDGKEHEKIKKIDIEDVVECDECGALIPRAAIICEFCGAEQKKKEKKEKTIRESKLQSVDTLPLPNSEKIYQYTKSKGQNINFAFKILGNQIVDLFRFHGVPREDWINAGVHYDKQIKRIKQIARQCYFDLNKREDITCQTFRKLDTFYEKIFKQIDDYYCK